MTSPSNMERIKHLCGYSFFFLTTHFILFFSKVLHTQLHITQKQYCKLGVPHNLLLSRINALFNTRQKAHSICMSTNKLQGSFNVSLIGFTWYINRYHILVIFCSLCPVEHYRLIMCTKWLKIESLMMLQHMCLFVSNISIVEIAP